MTFKSTDNGLLSRIDRSYIYDDDWIWTFADLQPAINYYLIVHANPHGFACFNEGQNSFFTRDPSVAIGNADSYLTDYLIHQAHQFALPWLLGRFVADAHQLRE